MVGGVIRVVIGLTNTPTMMEAGGAPGVATNSVRGAVRNLPYL